MEILIHVLTYNDNNFDTVSLLVDSNDDDLTS